jgi:hypothetical protein
MLGKEAEETLRGSLEVVCEIGVCRRREGAAVGGDGLM